MQRPLSRAAVWLPLLLTTVPLLAAAPPTAPAAAAKWTAVGPNGGAVNVLAAGARVLYAGTSGGVYVSADAGANWTLEARQIGQQPIYALAVDPLHPKVLYAGTRAEGIWKSTDGAASWAPAGAGLPRLAVSALAIDPVHTSVLYAALSVGLTDPVPSGPWKSTDSGRTWARASAGLPSDVILGLAVDPANPAVVYAATHLHGVWKSADGGTTWTELDTTFTGALRVAARPHTGGTLLFAVSTADGGPEGIFRSADGGATWTDVSPPGVVGTDLPLGFGPGGLVYTQRAKSTDSGDHWTFTSTFGLAATALLVDPLAPGTVYGGSVRGLWKSADGAASWAGASRGLHATAIAEVAVNPVSGGVFTGVDGSGLVRLRQATKSEDPAAWRPVLGEAPGFMVFDPTRPSTLYAGLNGTGRKGRNSILKSTDGGTTWAALPLADDCLELADLAVDPTDPSVLYAGGVTNGDHDCLMTRPLTFKSTDGGASWLRLTLPAAARFQVDPVDPRTVYAVGFASQTGVYRSTDRGATWHLASNGLPGGNLWDLALDPTAPERLFVSSAAGIYGSVDGARSWRLVSRALKDATVLRLDPKAPQHLYAGIPGVGAFVSRNGGKGWSALDDGHLPALFSGALALDPTTAGRLYVGTEGAGLFRVDVVP